MLCSLVLSEQFSMCARACVCARQVWMHTCIRTWKREQSTWDCYTAEKVVSYCALKACLRIAGCWHQSPGLVVVDEGVRLGGAWHGREGGRVRGTEGPVCCCHGGWHSRRAAHRWVLTCAPMRGTIRKQRRQG